MVFRFVIFDREKNGLSKWTNIAYLYTFLKKGTDFHIDIKKYLKSELDMAINENYIGIDFIGLPLLQDNHEISLEFSRIIKEYNKNIIIMLGNIDATIYGNYIMKNYPFVDYIIKGESEETMPKLCKKIIKHQEPNDVNGILYRKGTDIIETPQSKSLPDLDLLSYPDRSFLKGENINTFSAITTRGCSGYCTFCNSNTLNTIKTVRVRSVDNIIKEMKHLYYEYHCIHIDFTDSVFLGGYYELIEEFYEKLKKENLKITFNFNFTCERININMQQLFKKLMTIGLEFIYIGIEAGNKNDLKLYGKKATLSDNINAIKLLKEINLYFMYGFIMFNPYSTLDTIKENIVFFESTGLIVDFSILSRNLWVFGDTPLLKLISKDGLTTQKIDEPIYDNLCYHYKYPEVSKLQLLISYCSDYLNLEGTEDSLSYYLLYQRYINNAHADEEIFAEITDYEQYITMSHINLFKELVYLTEKNKDIDIHNLDMKLDVIKENMINKKEKLTPKIIRFVKELYSKGLYKIS